MGLPTKVYVATKALGVYYTENFGAPEDPQPTWVTVNDGLASLAISNFQVDPFDRIKRQYCVAEGMLYVRVDGGAWTVLLSAAQVQAMSADYAVATHVWCDETVQGRIWLGVNDITHEDRPHQWALCSHDYGITWPIIRELPYRLFHYYKKANIVARGNYVCMLTGRYAGGAAGILFSTDMGVTWAENSGDSSVVDGGVAIRRSTPPEFYFIARSSVGTALLKANPSPPASILVPLNYMPAPGYLWQNANDPDHMRCMSDHRILYTHDNWATYDSSPSLLSFNGKIFAPYVDSTDPDKIIFGGIHGSPAVGAFLGETNSHLWVSRAGTNWNTAPYTDAIPSNHYDVADDGVQVVWTEASGSPVPAPGETIIVPGVGPVTLGGAVHVQSVSMPDYTGVLRGTPIPSDNAAWDDETHGDDHARDIADASFVHHMDPLNPPPRALADLNDVDTTGALTGDALLYDETTEDWLPGDVLTPDEHTSIGDSAPHHAAATLGAGSDPALALNGQEFTLTLPEDSGGVDEDARKLIWMGW